MNITIPVEITAIVTRTDFGNIFCGNDVVGRFDVCHVTGQDVPVYKFRDKYYADTKHIVAKVTDLYSDAILRAAKDIVVNTKEKT